MCSEVDVAMSAIPLWVGKDVSDVSATALLRDVMEIVLSGKQLGAKSTARCRGVYEATGSLCNCSRAGALPKTVCRAVSA